MKNAGTAGPQPDMFLNTRVNSFVECVLAPANNEATVLDIERHIRRFLGVNPHYNIGGKEYAVLVYQTQGQVPISLRYLDDIDEPMTIQMCQDIQAAYQTRVFTFLMQTRAIYLGSQIVVAASR